MNSSTIFEKTMSMCLESKKQVNKKKSKTINEAIKRTRVCEDFDEEEEIDTINPMDIEDDIVVVIDPELDPDDVDAVANDTQDFIDIALANDELPSTDEYIGDLTYTCPICGNTFFSDHELEEGDACLVCGEFPNGFLLVGEIADSDDISEEDIEDLEDIDDEIEGQIDSIIKDEESDEELDPDLDIAEDNRIVDEFESRKASIGKKKVGRKAPALKLDETTFNPFLNKFIRENYRNAKSFVITDAKIVGKSLHLECKLTFKSGKSKKVALVSEGFKPAKSMIIHARDNGAFKTESKKVAPFVFRASMNNGVITCEGFKYNLITTANEGKKVQIFGSLIKESK